jgi:hypothetical protein
MTSTISASTASDLWRVLPAPLTLTAAGCPGVTVGTGYVACTPTRIHGGRRYWRITIAGDDGVILYDADDDISHPLRPSRDGDQACDVITTVLALLASDIGTYAAAPSADVADRWMFNPATAAWAHAHHRILAAVTDTITTR